MLKDNITKQILTVFFLTLGLFLILGAIFNPPPQGINLNIKATFPSNALALHNFRAHGEKSSALASAMLAITPNVSLELFTQGLNRPVDSSHAGDNRLCVVEQAGRIRIVEADGILLSTPFLDITNQVESGGNEQGLLGLAFHPDYATNGYFYLNYTKKPGGDTRISRFAVNSSDPNQADPNSEVVLLTVVQDFKNHNGGDLNFGPDGYLYIGLGDGGSGGDPNNRAQDPAVLLGKMLRLDVNTETSYLIPPDNPFAGDPGARDEIWAMGLRNPWRFSFDRLTGDLYIADVGQNAWEEIDFQAAGLPGGENYGWRCYEGDVSFNLTGCSPAENYTVPVHIYGRGQGCSITGGYVYRGRKYPVLEGHYLFADYCTGTLWSLIFVPQDGWQVRTLGNIPGNPSTFGENIKGDLFVAGLSTGTIYRLVENTLAIDLQINKTVPSNQVLVGDRLTYTLLITQAGVLSATDVVLTDPLPTEVIFHSVTPSQGACSPLNDSFSRQTLLCHLGDLLANESVVVTLTVTVKPTLASKTHITNTAFITSKGTELDLTNNTITASVTTVEAPIMGLRAHNNSPTESGTSVALTATLETGSNVVYTWAFGDGATGAGQLTRHTYSRTDTYTAIVTASNALRLLTATTTVTIFAPPSSDPLNPAIILHKTVSRIPGCALPGANNLVLSGTTTLRSPSVTYCYLVQNRGNVTFTRHTLTDDQLGVLLDNYLHPLVPNEIFTYTQSSPISQSVTNIATWQAADGQVADRGKRLFIMGVDDQLLALLITGEMKLLHARDRNAAQIIVR